MNSTPRYHELGKYRLLGGLTSAMGAEADQKTKASKTRHSEAERRRRMRINGHLDTLRSLLPDTVKTDKASLLTEVVRNLRELKRTTPLLPSTIGPNSDISQFSMSPTEVDILEVHQTESGLIRASMCCDDRPDLIVDVAATARVAALNIVRAEMATIGRRSKVVLWAQGGGNDGMGQLGRGLKFVIDKTASPDHKRPHYSDDTSL